MSTQTIDIVFDGSPGPQSGRFVEVERHGASISMGEWIELGDGLWALRIPDSAALEAKLEAMERIREAAERLIENMEVTGNAHTGGLRRALAAAQQEEADYLLRAE